MILQINLLLETLMVSIRS